MTVRKEKSGRWLAVVKWQGRYHSSKAFATKKDAVAWEDRQRAALSGGTDPKAGRVLIESLLPEWLEHRKATVAFKTHQSDNALIKWIPRTMLRTGVGQVTKGTVSDAMAGLAKAGKARSSIQRFRAMLSAFFTWAEHQGFVTANPTKGVRIPSATAPPEEMRPFNAPELADAIEQWLELDVEVARQAEFLAASGLRWSEARALVVGDFQRVPYPAVTVAKAHPEGGSLKTTKNRKERRVPLPDDIAAWIESRTANRAMTAYLMPERWAAGFKRRLHWQQTASGRRIYDLRHTAITGWLTAGVDVGTVRTWAGHADLTTTSRYVHWLGSDADRAALDRLNQARSVNPLAPLNASGQVAGK